MIFGRKKGIFCLIVLIVLFCAFTAKGSFIYQFHIFNNSNWEKDNRLAFTVSVSDEGQNKQGKNLVSFLFENKSLTSSSITAVYFDTDSLLSMDKNFLEGPGVNFSQGASPNHLPGGDTLAPKFAKPADFSADSDSKGGSSNNGINQEEWLKITFMLAENKTYNNIIEELSNNTQENLRIGLHIQSLPDGNSVSAINYSQPLNPPSTPEPATICLLAIGLLGLRKKK